MYAASACARGSIEMNAYKDGFGMGVGDRDTSGERNKRIIPPGQNGFETGFLKCLVQAQSDIEWQWGQAWFIDIIAIFF